MTFSHFFRANIFPDFNFMLGSDLLNLDENFNQKLSIKRGKLKWQNESVKLSQNKNEENHAVLGVSKCVSKAFSPQRWHFPYLKVP